MQFSGFDGTRHSLEELLILQEALSTAVEVLKKKPRSDGLLLKRKKGYWLVSADGKFSMNGWERGRSFTTTEPPSPK